MARDQDLPSTAASPAAAQPSPSERATGRLPAVLATVVPLALLTCLMAAKQSFDMSVPFGAACLLLASWGLLDLMQSFDAPRVEPAVSDEVSLRALSRPLLGLAAGATALVAALRVAVAGTLPFPVLTSAILVPASFFACVLAGYHVALRLRLLSGDQPLHQRYGFWIMLLHALVYLPMLGSFSLIDPWETHYGEVAREMLVRDDWLSLWWAQDGWFWSKPVLDFWLQGLSFSLLGVNPRPDQVLSGIAQGYQPHPEWAARFPVFLLTLGACYVLYKAVAASIRPRVGFLSALVLSSMPYWFLMSHQSMTDMPYVAPLVACLGCFLLGFSKARDALPPRLGLSFRGRQLELCASQLLVLLVCLCVLPQVCYLLSRHLTLDVATGVLDLHLDRFSAGSGGGNCGLPGNAECKASLPASPTWQPGLLALFWLFLLLVLVRLITREQRLKPLYYLAGWVCLSLSMMAKGAPGLVLPLFVIAIFLAATGRWRELLELRPGALVLIFAVLVLPWYLQLLARHGPAFLERLLLHDMYKRAFQHVHDTNDGVDVSFRYYLWQLGYGLFPWSGLAAAGLLRWLQSLGNTELEKRQASVAQAASFFGLWFIAGFSLFAVSGTKFHHYILPAVPPLAVLAGWLLDDLLGECSARRRRLPYLLGLGAATLLALGGLRLLLPGPIGGLVPPDTDSMAGSPALGAALLLLSVGLAAFAVHNARAWRLKGGTLFGAFVFPLFATLGVWLVGRDFLVQQGEGLPGQVLLMQLFTYQYHRPWPDSLDFSGSLLAFTVLGSLLFGLQVFPATRKHASVAVCTLALAWSAWGLDLYLVRAAPHWGQRESIAAYYRLRQVDSPPLVGFQMNWKGENFYTGNRLAAFVKTGKPFKRWLEQQRKRGVRTLYFTTEPSRASALKRELGEFRHFEILTSPRVNNKFMIAKVDL